MHPLLASTALGLVAAWPVGALGFGLGRLVERLTEDPRPRAAAWSLAYALPAGALAATVVLTFAPQAPILAPKAAPVAMVTAQPAHMTMVETTAPEPAWTPPPALANGLAWSLVGLSAAGLLARGWRWNRGRRQLARIRAEAQPCQDYALIDAVRQRAARLGVKAPRVRTSAAIAEPLLAGARRPVILLPQALANSTDARRLELVCGHELAHLRRGDNWRIPAEEALAGLFWLAPPVAALRGRMLAAREAVCDLTALDGAAPEARRDYARVLVEALRMNALPAPQSAFTGRERALARMRLSAILQPRGDASALRVAMVFALGGALTAATGAGSLALADQARRVAPPEVAPAPPADTEVEAAAEAAPVAIAKPARAMTARVARVAAVAPVAEVAPVLPMASPSPAPSPDPQPNPNPQPNPDPHPDPHPRASLGKLIAEMRNAAPTRREVVFLGDVSVTDQLDPVQVNLKINGVQASPHFQPNDLRIGQIKRLEVTDQRIATDGKITVNVVLNSDNS